jgi:hypothetical protein
MRRRVFLLVAWAALVWGSPDANSAVHNLNVQPIGWRFSVLRDGSDRRSLIVQDESKAGEIGGVIAHGGRGVGYASDGQDIDAGFYGSCPDYLFPRDALFIALGMCTVGRQCIADFVGGLRLTECLDDLRYAFLSLTAQSVVKFDDGSIKIDGDLCCRFFAGTSESEFDGEVIAALIDNGGASDLWRIDVNPRPLIGAHDIQLALYRIKLPFEDEELRYSDANSGQGKERDRNSSVGRSSREFILGGFLILFGVPLLKIAFYVFDGPRDPRWLRRIGWVLGIISAYLIIQGVVLALTGAWWS